MSVTISLVYEEGDANEISTAESLQYSFGIIKAATNDFSENNVGKKKINSIGG
ncbi:hypothetical protein HanRHA438_Chr15g0692751 [Helianthus annuus]|nr:hypothetical protein HanRHA438_Chr15g0692751 [Helianthus annuus]